MYLVSTCGMFFLNTWTGFVLNLEVPIDFRCLEACVWLQSGRSPCFKKSKHGPQLSPLLPSLKDLPFPFDDT